MFIKIGNIFNYNFDVRKGPIFIKCMEDAVTNICYNCLDVHVKAGHGDVVAFYWLVSGNIKNFLLFVCF